MPMKEGMLEMQLGLGDAGLRWGVGVFYGTTQSAEGNGGACA